jgi:multiple sugar transport system permease protein
MSISAAELRAKAALGPKRTGPLVGLARMLGPDYRLGYLFILPTVVLVLALVAYPFCYAIYLSMTRKYVGVPPVFVGFDNYVKITFDGFFQRAVVNSFIFTFGSVGVKLVLGMLMALVLTSRIRFRSFWTGVLLIPWVAPTVVSALNFLWIFDYSLGVLNYLLVKVFHLLPQGVGWLSEPGTAMASVIGVNIWRGFPFFGISFLAGLRAIPGELYEAAAVDGAGPWRRFVSISLPSLRPVVAFVTVMLVIGGFNVFISVFLITNGGPLDETQVLLTYMYRQAFTFLDFGYGSAISFTLTLIVAVLSLVQLRLFRRPGEAA